MERKSTGGTILASSQGISIVQCEDGLEAINPGPEGMGCLLEHLGQGFLEQVVQMAWNSGPLGKQLLNLSCDLGLFSSRLGSLVLSMSVIIPHKPQLVPFLEDQINDSC